MDNQKEDSETALVEIKYMASLSHAKAIVDGRDISSQNHIEAAQAALDAHKSPYERWNEEQYFPWQRSRSGNRVIDDMGEFVVYREAVDLMAAAPMLLQALIDACRVLLKDTIHDRAQLAPVEVATAAAAIRAAVPEDVYSDIVRRWRR